MSPTPNSPTADLQQVNADLQRQLAEARAERDESEAQKAAITEVLGVINSSPGDLAPVFDAMLEKAMRLCAAAFGYLETYDGEHFHPVATRGLPAAYADYLPQRDAPGSSSSYAQILGGARYVHVADLREGEAYHTSPLRQALVDLGGARSSILVALRREDVLLGSLVIYRREVRPFSEKEIALLQNFAAQAVIAMDNARLLTETREALEQQTGTAEVLGVINSSPGDLKPVFEAILDKAHGLCGVEYGVLLTYDGELFWPVAMRGAPPSLERRNGFRPSSGFRGLLGGERLLHIHDMAEVAAQRPDEPVYRDLFERFGVRTQLAVPLRKDGRLLGIIIANRREVRPFSDKQIALLENFAAQAVIAIENARLLIETREALEQQTATAQVLGVINSSPGDLAPVFDTMLENATRLCEAPFGVLRTWDGERYNLAAANGDAKFVEWAWNYGPFAPVDASSPAGRIVAGEGFVQFADAPAEEAHSIYTDFRAFVDASSMRSGVTVALRKDDALLGNITVYRQEVRPFTDKQIALLQNFAAQAVIAMENARLITETREALEQQTATAEVLQVINSSAGDLTPVFDA